MAPAPRIPLLPRLIAAVVGVACVVVGAVLTVRPFTSLAVLVLLVGVAMIVGGVTDGLAASRDGDRTGVVVSAAWVLAGAIVLAWPDATLTVLRLFVGVGMVVSGLVHLVAALRGARPDRFTAGVSGLAGVVFGVLALSWPDVTILVIAVVFGARTVLAGLLLLIDAAFPAHAETRAGRRAERASSPSRVRRVVRGVRAVAGLVIALLLLAISAALHKASPRVDAFYVAPATVPAKPGHLLRSEPFSQGVPSAARAWRILYTTTRRDGVPALASGIVLVGKDVPAGPRPVIAWAHGTTGFARQCAPSLLKDPFGAGAMPDLDQVVANGWVLVATDYTGLGTAGAHPYLIGQGEARSVLDAVRAARQLRGVTLSDRTVVWGHSQGGGAALWTGQVQPTYAPDVPLAGVAAMAPASDLLGLAGNLDKVPGGSLFMSFILAAYRAEYPDVRIGDYVRPGAVPILERASGRCLSEPSTLVSVATSLALDKSVLTRPAAQGAFGRRLQQNTATGPIPAPLLIAQGGADPLVLPAVQRAYAARLCASGQKLDYRVYSGYDHVGVVSGNSPLLGDLLTWTKDRLGGRPAVDNCARL